MYKILIVDHHTNKRVWLEKILREAKYEVIAAQDGMAGLQAFRDQAPDAVVLTMTLPKISGSDLSLKIKSTTEGGWTPVILTSPIFKNMQLDSIAKSRWKTDAFLEEPFKKTQFLSILETQINAYAEKKAAAQEAEDESPLEEEIDPFEAVMAAAEIATEGLEKTESDRVRERPKKAPTKIAPRAAAAPPHAEKPAGPELLIESAGELGDTGIPEIFAAIFFARVTGILAVTNNANTKKIFFRKGLPVFVESSMREETLGQILLTHGLIDEAQHRSTLESMAEKNLRQGDALIDIGALNPTQLYQALKLQAQEKMLSLFSWREGHYAFGAGEFNTATMTIFEMWTPLLILQGVLRFYEAVHIRSIFNELQDFVLKRNQTPPLIYGELRFPPEVDDFIRLVDGRRTVGEVIKSSTLEGARTYQVFFVLLVLEQFDKIDPGQVGRPSGEELPGAGVSLDSLVAELFTEEVAAKDIPELAASGAEDAPPAPAAGLADQLEPEPAAVGPEISPPTEVVEPELAEAPPAVMTMDRAHEELRSLFEKTDAESGVSEEPEEAPPAAPKPQAEKGRVAFDLDEEIEDDGNGLSPEEEIPALTEREAVTAGKESARKSSAPDTAVETDGLPLSDELTNALDDFLKDVDETEKTDSIEETVQIMMDDLRLGEPLPETPASGEGAPAATAESAEGLPSQGHELDTLVLPEEDRRLLDEILADNLALAKATFYEVLHVDAKAADKDIRDAYTTLVKKYHPDHLGNKFPDEVIRKANEVMARATEGYRTLYDFKKRKEYDKQLLAGGGPKKERSITMILKAEREFGVGATAMKAHQWAAAKTHFEQAVEMFPEEGEYHAYLGWAIYNLTNQSLAERTKQARELLEKAVRLNPRSDKSYYYLGLLLKDCNLLDKAALMFAQSFRYNKNNIDARNQLKAIQVLRTRRPESPRPETPDPSAPRPRPTARPGGLAGSAKKPENVLNKDINFNSVKKAMLKIFW